MPDLPTRDELNALPKRAQAAFCVCCILRSPFLNCKYRGYSFDVNSLEGVIKTTIISVIEYALGGKKPSSAQIQSVKRTDAALRVEKKHSKNPSVKMAEILFLAIKNDAYQVLEKFFQANSENEQTLLMAIAIDYTWDTQEEVLKDVVEDHSKRIDSLAEDYKTLKKLPGKTGLNDDRLVPKHFFQQLKNLRYYIELNGFIF